ncbi:hypothetical protein HPB51_012941 [Rhipicephalus microplus]|uniref:BHLH domain-containing protein n=1 Tax=Rhipicephalus microplus TaxID=6941 RepID=A0A9J6F2B3_RHIMP|nr:hypothetical protein HPB51_012941 [Rhipicephalus microplus]
MYISEMASLEPMCKAMSQKLDKLTVLRMVVQHIKTIRGSINSYMEGHYELPWLLDEDVKNVVLQDWSKFLSFFSLTKASNVVISSSVHMVRGAREDVIVPCARVPADRERATSE